MEGGRISKTCSLVLRRQSSYLLRNLVDRAGCGSAAHIADFSEEADCGILVPSPLVWQIVFIEDGFGRAHRLTCATLAALVRIDVQGTRTLVDAIDRALVHTSLVLDVHARLGDNVWHDSSLA